MPEFPLILTIEKLDHKARGVACLNDSRYVCDDVLPGEKIQVLRTEQRRHLLYVTEYELLEPIAARVTPPCPYFSLCGGCQLQHLTYPAQLDLKNSQLRNLLQACAELDPLYWKEPISGDALHYRHRARLSLYQPQSGQIIIGFHRRHHSHILDIDDCAVLDPRLAALLAPLHGLVPLLSFAHRLPQIELAAGDNQVAAVFRHLQPVKIQDEILLRAFADEHMLQVYTQSAGPDSMQFIGNGEPHGLYYSLPEFDLDLAFQPADFIQANAGMNRRLVGCVMHAMQLQQQDRVLELFCGAGNFSLPAATGAGSLLGIEYSEALVQRAWRNAGRNNISNVEFLQSNLSEHADIKQLVAEKYNKLLLDPPREGAIEALKGLPTDSIARVVYVSCNPLTLVRDLSFLIRKRNFVFESIQLIDMFPHTNHIEVVAVLSR